MQYLLVEDRSIVHLGPIEWRPRLIKSELEDHDLIVTLSPVEPNGYLSFGSFEIFPAVYEIPSYDALFQQLAGPFWSYSDTEATGTYSVIDRPIDLIKGDINTRIAAERYNREVSGVKAIVQGYEVTVDTSRDGRNIFVQALNKMSDTDTINWKFPERWLTVTKSDMTEIVNAGANHIQAQFDWEMNSTNQVNAEQNIDELKVLYNELFPAPPIPDLIV